MNALSPIHQAMFVGLADMHYRRIVGGAELEQVGVLRQRAYDSRTVFAEKCDGPLVEDLDSKEGFYTFGLYNGDDMLATVRLGHLSRSNPSTLASGIFPTFLSSLVAQGQHFIDPSRLAVDPRVAETFPALPVYMLRVAFIATFHFEVDQCLSVVKKEHEGFYRRVFRSSRLAGPSRPDDFAIDLVLLGSPPENRQPILDRYPIFHYSEEEANALFADIPEGQTASRPIYPTAAEAAGLDVTEFAESEAYKVA